MTRLRGTLAAVGLSMGWLAAAATAVPPVLDRVPDNAMIVVAMPSADAVQKNIQSLITATELPVPMVPKVEDLLAMAGVTEGFDTSKSVALVVFAPPADMLKKLGEKGKLPEAIDKAKDGKEPGVDIQPTQDEDKEPELVVALVPITNYEGLLKNFDAKPEPAGGVSKVSMPSGEDAFFKDVGNGYVAMSPTRDLLEKFDAKSGAAALKGKLGKAGTALADSGDIIVIANMDVVRPMWPELKKQMEEKIKEEAENLPMGGEAPNPMDNPAFTFLADSIMRDGKAVVMSLKTGSSGINVDMAANFNEGSPMAKVFSGTSASNKLLAKLPNTSYLFAGAIDLANAEIKSFMKELGTKAGGPAEGPMSVETTMKKLENTEGASVVVGVPAGGIMGGLTTSTIMYTSTKDVPGYIASQKKTMAELDGKSQGGMKMTSTYKDATQKVEGVDVDEYSVRMTADPDSDEGQMASQMINGIFGPTGGPAGYIAKTEGGVYQTMGKNSQLLGSALKAGTGGESLGSDKLLTQVGQGMPSNRIAEGYIGTKGLLDMALPLAAMFGGIQIPPEQIPDSLPPVGMSLAGSDGAAHFALFVPAPVINTGAKLAMTIQQQMEEGFGEGEGEEAPAGDKGKTGQPKF